MTTSTSTPKHATIIKTRTSQNGTIITTETTGSLEYLTNYFSYTLQCGNAYNKKINRTPKTFKGLVAALNKSYEETETGYNTSSVSLA